MMKQSKKFIFSLIVLSFFIHLGILNLTISKIPTKNIHIYEIAQTPQALKIRKLGIENGIESQNIAFRKKTKQKGLDEQEVKPKLENLAFKELPFDKVPENQEEKKSQSLKTESNSFKRLNPNKTQLGLSDREIKKFLKTPSPGYISSSQALKSLGESDLNFGLEIPKGVSENELNQRELVFYSFQKRIAQGYVNSFQKELNQFERQNPHKKFPMTSEKKVLSGRVIYDMNGDILRIQTQRLEDIAELKTFFLDVLNNMSSLPNPPEEIIENKQFAINFVLVLNN